MSIYDGFMEVQLSDERLKKISDVLVGSRSFDEMVPTLSNLKEVLSAANKVERFVTDDVRNNVTEQLNKLDGFLISAESLDAYQVSNAGEQFERIVSAVKATCSIIINSLLPAIAMRTYGDNDWLRDREEEVSRIVQKLQTTEKVVGSQQAEIATEHAAQFFKAKAKSYRKASNSYGWALGVSFILAIGFTLIFRQKFTPGSQSNWTSLEQALPTLNILAVAWFAIRLLSKNLRVNQNLAVTNETKAMILEAGERFSVSSVGQNVTKEVLMTVIDSTFTISESGYLPHEGDGNPFTNSGIPSLLRGGSEKG